MSTVFNYTAVEASGKQISGELVADSKRSALAQLSENRLTVVELREVQHQRDPDEKSRARLSSQDIHVALYELASMLTAGVSAVDAVSAQAESAPHPKLRVAFKRAEKTLRHGGSFEQAISATKLPLPGYVGYLIKAGELTGMLGPALRDACAQMQYDQSVRNDTRNALIYPAILVGSGILAVLMMFVYVVPSFTNLLEHADRLPWLAWAVLTTGQWANENFLLLCALIASPFVLLFSVWSRPAIRVRILEWVEKLPGVGDWVSQADVASWSKVLASLLKHRVELTVALDLATESVKLPSRKHRLSKAKSAVRAGEALSKALEQHRCLTATGYNLIRVGEKSGKLDEMLAALATLYAEQGRQRMKKLLLLIEPVAILVIGLFIGTIIIGIILAITSANDIPL